jgi:peptidoglycan/xylan/chitin deacetylase (PgdA/CDA1 family)
MGPNASGRDAATTPARRSRTATLAAWHDTPVIRTVAGMVPAWRGVLSLNYHRIGDGAGSPFDRALYSATAETFDAHLALLAREADVIGPGDVAGALAARRGRHVLLTFDDGYRDNYEVAFPLLRRHGLQATFFLTSGFLDHAGVAWWDEISWMVRNATATRLPAFEGLPLEVPLARAGGGADDDVAIRTLIAHYKRLPGADAARFLDVLAEATGAGRCPAEAARDLWMTWDMARAMRDGGMTIGGHTVTHPVLARVGAAEQEHEIAGCARRLRAELDLPLRWFSYPVGGRDTFDADTREALRRQGTELAFSFYGGYQRVGRLDPYDVPRVYVGPQLTRQVLFATVRLPQLLARAD